MKKLLVLFVLAVACAAAFTLKAANPYLTDTLKTTTELQSMTPAEGQIVVDSDKSTLSVGDGSTAGGILLAKESQLIDKVSYTDTGHVTDTGVVTNGYVVMKLGNQSYKVMTTP